MTQISKTYLMLFTVITTIVFGQSKDTKYNCWELLYGQKFTSDPADYKTTNSRYQKGKDKYIEIDYGLI